MLKKLLSFLIAFFALSIILVPSSFASTLYLSPASANIPAGTTVSVSVGINTAGESVNGVSAYLSYPADKLEVAWISYGSKFDIAAEGIYGGGSIRISRGSISGVVGNVNLATIGFKGKAQGAATVAFVSGSAAARSSDSSDSLSLAASGGGVYTVVASQPGVAATVTITPKPAIQLLISNLNVTSISTNSATIAWETNEKSDSTLEYGLTPNKYFLSIYDKTPTATHTAKLEGVALMPGATFHFRVKSKDEGDNEVVSNDGVFQLVGYNVKVMIVDTANNPLKDTNVYLYTDPQISRTNVNGEAHFANVTAGKHLVVVKLENKFDKTGEINVLDSAPSQSFVLTVDTTKSEANGIGVLVGLLALIILLTLTVGIVLVIRMLRKRNPL